MLLSPALDHDLLEEVHALQPDEVVRELTAALGRPVVAMLADIRETKLVGQWERGDVVPQMNRDFALKTALQVVRVLQPRYKRGSIISWLSGTNPRLQGEAPVEVLARMSRHYTPDDARTMLNAAKAFANR